MRFAWCWEIFWMVEKCYGLNSFSINVTFFSTGYTHTSTHYFRHNEDSLVESVGDHHEKSCTSPDFWRQKFSSSGSRGFSWTKSLGHHSHLFQCGLDDSVLYIFSCGKFVALALLSFFIEFAWGFRWYLIRRIWLSDNLGYRTFCVKW